MNGCMCVAGYKYVKNINMSKSSQRRLSDISIIKALGKLISLDQIFWP